MWYVFIGIIGKSENVHLCIFNNKHLRSTNLLFSFVSNEKSTAKKETATKLWSINRFFLCDLLSPSFNLIGSSRGLHLYRVINISLMACCFAIHRTMLKKKTTTLSVHSKNYQSFAYIKYFLGFISKAMNSGESW